MSDNIIQTANLWKTYKDRAAVRELDLHIKKGDIYGFLGPNGAGKTTTIRMLLGLIKPTKGVIRVFDKDIRKDRMDILRRIGSLVEYPSYYGHLNAVENLEVLRRIINVPKSRIAEVLSIVDLTKDAKRSVKGYSLGMKQRLGIASALLGEPELLILDEPTNGLDPAGIQEIRELIKRMPLEHGITVLVSSHLLSEVEQMASRVGIIRDGKMVMQDTMASLHSQTGSSIKLTVSEPEEAMKLAREQGQFAQREGAALTFPYMDNSAVALLVRRLIEQDHDVYRVEEQRQSLEDLFMRVIGEGLPMTGRALSADWLKIRGKGIWFLVFLAPIGLTAMQALNFGLRLDYLKEQYADNLWGGLLGNVVVFVPLALMLGATILSSMIAGIEHEQGSWKQLLAMPIRRPAVYLAKFLLACVLLMISCLLLTAGVVGLGLVLGFDAKEIPWAQALKLGLMPLAGALPVLSIELWFTLVSKNQALPVTFGIILAITGMFSLSISPQFPLAWAQMAWSAPDAYLYAGMGAGLGIVILLTGMLHFSRKDVA